MKKRQIKVILLVVSIMVSLCACSGGDGLSVDKDSAQARREEMWKYRDNDKVNQILYVTHTDGSNAIAEFYEKNADEGNAWVMVFRTDAFIGVDQMGQPDEQSGRTPLGDYGIGFHIRCGGQPDLIRSIIQLIAGLA